MRNYGWRPECARDQRVVLPSNTWLVYQAQSYLGRQVNLEEAQELFSRIDVHTRQPIQPPRPRRWYDGLLDRWLVSSGRMGLHQGSQ